MNNADNIQKRNMRILVSPMAAMAETSGPSSRVKALVEGFRDAGVEVATCMAEDVNYKKIDGVKNYFLDVPMPMGLPGFIAKRTFPVAQKLGVTSKKTVNSFDQVLRFTGNLDYKYLKKSVASVRKAIREFKPDAVYSEFNISAIIAARKEKIPICASVSYPTQHEYAHDSKLTGGLNRLLGGLALPRVYSALQLFDWADMRFCPSIRELEPIEELKGFPEDSEEICYCGTFKKLSGERQQKVDTPKNKVLVYMGNGTVPASKTLEVMKEVFRDGKYEVYIASSYLEEETIGNIHVAPRWDFSKLLDESVLFINHGGQNSIVDGLLHGVPQIIVPGKVFERIYNAKSVADNGAGVMLSYTDFDAAHIGRLVDEITCSESMTDNSYSLGQKLTLAGGVDAIISELGG